MISKGQITKIENHSEIYPNLVANMGGAATHIQGETVRGILFSFYVHNASRFNVGDRCEVWGKGFQTNGLRCFSACWEGVQINGETIFRSQDK